MTKRVFIKMPNGERKMIFANVVEIDENNATCKIHDTTYELVKNGNGEWESI